MNVVLEQTIAMEMRHVPILLAVSPVIVIPAIMGLAHPVVSVDVLQMRLVHLAAVVTPVTQVVFLGMRVLKTIMAPVQVLGVRQTQLVFQTANVAMDTMVHCHGTVRVGLGHVL